MEKDEATELREKFFIHIDDVKRHLELHPEPKEVTRIRKLIQWTYERLEFVEEGHHYFLPTYGGQKEELQSVSAFVHQFEPETDWEQITENYATKHNIPIEDVKRAWKENNLRATNNGTSTHLYGENMMYFCLNRLDLISPILQPQLEQGYLLPYSHKQMAAMNFYKEVMATNNLYPVLAETKVYVDNDITKSGYAGTFDMLFAFKSGNKYKLIIGDFKTNNSLYSPFNENNGVMMQPPFDDMVDEALSHYTIQLSAYQIPLNRIGYEVADRKIIWLKDDESYEKISVPDVTNRINKYLKS